MAAIGFALVHAYTPEPGGEKVNDPAMAGVVDQPGLPRVMLIGDSISLGYTPLVREMLKGQANVHRPAANSGPTIAGLKDLDNLARRRHASWSEARPSGMSFILISVCTTSRL